MWTARIILGISLSAQGAANEVTPEAASAAAPTPSGLELAATAFQLVEHEANTKENLSRGIELYDHAMRDEALTPAQRVPMLVDQARAWLRLGDLYTDTSRKIAAYEKGNAAAQRAQKLNPGDADAVFWETANLANIGQARGIMSSLFMVPDIKSGFEKALVLDPNHAYARDTLAKVLHVVPGLAGGDSERAEKLWLENLRRHPRFTPSMVEYGRFLKDEGRNDEAKRMFEKVLQEKAPVPASDWKKFNLRDAKAELASL